MSYVFPSLRPVPTFRYVGKPGEVRHRFDRGLLKRLLRDTVKKAQARSIVRGHDDRISSDEVVDLFLAQEGRCALTGVEMTVNYDRLGTRDPLRPSLDRIDPSLGYVPGNCRLTTLIANVARCDFGDEAFYAMCRAAIRHVAPAPDPEKER